MSSRRPSSWIYSLCAQKAQGPQRRMAAGHAQIQGFPFEYDYSTVQLPPDGAKWNNQARTVRDDLLAVDDLYLEGSNYQDPYGGQDPYDEAMKSG
jgi:hypothetical protein